ncbi:MAG TPA: hypothetical protein VGE52_05480, partial [Pirellulales bacterium]
RRVAENEETDADRIEQALDEVGKTTEELAAAVDLHAQRKEKRAALAAIPGQRKHTDAIRGKLTAAEAKLAAAKEEYRRTAGPLEYELRELDATTSRESALRHELTKTCPDADLLARLKEIEGESAAIREGIKSSEAEIARLGRVIDKLDASAEASSEHEVRRRGNLVRSIEEQRVRAGACRESLASLEAERESLRKRALEL